MAQNLTEIPGIKTVLGEVKLLVGGSLQDKRQYILWHGIKWPFSQRILADDDNKYLIWLQTYIHGNIWHSDAAEILYRRKLLKRPTDEDDVAAEQAFKGWLSTSLIKDRTSEADYGRQQSWWLCYSARRPSPVSEEKQLEWLRMNDTTNIMSYPYAWRGQAEIQFLTSAPEDAVYRYLRYNSLGEEAQCALVSREINSHQNNLLWYYFHVFKACLQAQQLIQDYDEALWREMIPVNYGWDYKYEQKFGCLAAWQSKLSDSWPLLAHCPIEEIGRALDSIA